MRLLLLPLFLALSAFAGDPAGDSAADPLVEKLFDGDPAARAKARASLAALGDDALERVLAGIEARQAGPAVVRVYDIADLEADAVWGRALLRRLKSIPAAEVTAGTARHALIVRAPPAIQQRIEREMQALRGFLGRLVSVRTRMVRLTQHLDEARSTEQIDPAALSAFLERHHAESIAAPQLACRSGQEASLEIVRAVAYVADFKIEEGREGDLILDPVIQQAKEGTSLRLRPVAAADGSSVRIALVAQVHELERPLTRLAYPLPSGQDAEIQIPTGRTLQVTRVVRCDRGAIAVVDLGGDSFLLIEAELLPADGDEEGR